MNNDSIHIEEFRSLQKKLNDLKTIQIDNYFVGNFCDALDLNKQWCVAEVIDRQDDKIKIHFEGWSNKFDEELYISKSRKITHFRRFSQGYTGQKSTAYRLYNFNHEDFLEIKNLIQEIKNKKFENLEDPLQITQILRGKIFTFIDIFMTCNLTKSNQDISETENIVIMIVGLLIDYLHLALEFLEYCKNNLKYSEVIEKYNDVFLIDKTSAIMASYFEFVLTITRIFGLDQRTSVFYTYNDEIVLKYLNNRLNSNLFKKICKDECYLKNSSYKNVLTFIIATLIDYFNHIGGFEILFEIIFSKFDSLLQNSNSPQLLPTPFYLIFYLFQIFEFIQPFIDFTANFSSEMMKFKEYFMFRINNMSESEIKEVDKYYIEGIASSIKNVFNIDNVKTASGIIYEELLLNYHFKCFISKNLEKRIKGISYINKAAEFLDKKDHNKNLRMQIDDEGEEEEEYIHVDANHFFLWLKEKNILDELLGENLHEEILKRCTSIFIIYARKSAIGTNIYDLLWKAFVERHESISSVIKSLLCNLILCMNDADKEYNFNKIKLFPLGNYNTQFNKFIKDLTINCIRSDMAKKNKGIKYIPDRDIYFNNNPNEIRESNLYGIPSIYHFMLDLEVTNANNYENIEIALESLKEIFETTNLNKDIIIKYILYCVGNLLHGHSIVQSLKLIKILLNQISEQRYQDYALDHSENILTIIKEKYMIIDLIIEDLHRYFEEVENKIKKITAEENNQMTDIGATQAISSSLTSFFNSENLSILNSNSAREYISLTFEGNYSHMTNIETRLDLIHFILQYSDMRGLPIEITNDHIIKLWDILVLNTRTENEKQILYKFLLQSNEGGGFSDEFSEKITESLFKGILTNPAKFQPDKINLIAFKLFQKYFNLINSLNGSLVILNRKIKITNHNLLGENTLWQILTHNKNDNVRRECSKILTSTCLNLDKVEEEFCSQIWKKFEKNLKENLINSIGAENFTNGTNKFSSIKNSIGIKGIIFLIKNFISELNSDGDIPSQEELTINNVNAFTVIFVNISRNEKKALNIGSTEFVSQVRDKISFIFDIPLYKLAFKQNRKIIDMNDDLKFLKELIDPNQVVEVIERKNPYLQFKNINPHSLIVENEYIFEILFKLLEVDETHEKIENNPSSEKFKKQFLQDAWELIYLLPIGKNLENKIFRLGKEKFQHNDDEYLNTHKSLEVFNSDSVFKLSYLLQIVKKFVECDSTWLINFISNKGIEILIHMLLRLKENNFTDDSNIGMKCLKDIFYVLDLCNQNLKENFYKLEEIKLHESSMIQKLIEIIIYIFKGSHSKDNDSKLKEIQSEYSKKRNREMIHRIFLKNKKPPSQDTENPDNPARDTNAVDFNNKNEDNSYGNLDEVHSTIRKIWNTEVEFIQLVLNFLNNFESDKIVEVLVSNKVVEKADNDDHMTVDTENKSSNINIQENSLYDLFAWCLIFPKNVKIKELMIERILLFASNCDNLIKENFYVNVYNFIFTEDVLIMPMNYRQYEDKNLENILNAPCEFFYRTILLLLSKQKITTDFVYKNSAYNKLRVDFLKISEHMMNHILKEISKITEGKSFSYSTVEENIIIGFLSILRELVLYNSDISDHVISKNLFDLLMNNSLFTNLQKNHLGKSNSSIVKTSQGRNTAFRLLTAISYNNPEYINKIIQTVTEYHKLGFWRTKRISDWNISASEEKSSTGLTGLKNLGCTCYMNSLMQQFFMIPSIREGVLSSADNLSCKNEESVLFQLKTIFASLLCSDRKFYNPKDFCQIFKNYDNQVMNVLEQMDVDEFFNLLIDRLEPFLKGTDQENLFKNHFAGTLVNQSICIGCPHYSETLEPFSSVILGVKNKKSIIESLESFVQGEMLEGDNAYYCDKCEKKVNTLRRQCIKQLPNVLVLVLKRFEFDFDTMVKMKVNDYCEFPFELDMENYTQEYLSNQKIIPGNSNKSLNSSNHKTNHKNRNKITTNCDYVLTGVIIHTGTADGGHYYSIIKNIEDGNWYEFNDAYVTPYDLNDLPEEAYGSKKQKGDENETLRVSNTSMLLKNSLREKGTNAYVLFYTKKSEIEKMNFNLGSTKNQIMKSQIQMNIMQRIQLDNHQFRVSKLVFSDEYCEFMQDLLINYNTENNLIYKQPMITKNANLDTTSLIKYKRNIQEIINLNIRENLFVTGLSIPNRIDTDMLFSTDFNEIIFKFACNFFFTSLIRYKEQKYLPSFMDILKANINLSFTNAEWLIEEFSNSEIITEFLVECPHPELRKLTCGILYCAMLKLSNEESFINDLNRLNNGDDIVNNSLLNFVQTILFLMNRKRQYLGKDFTFLYFIIWRFASLFLETKEFLIKRNFLKFLIKFFSSKNLMAGFNLPNRSMQSPNLIEESLKIKLREPKHKELSVKSMNKTEKLSPLEEMMEKKQIEKGFIPTDIYLLITLCEILRSTDLSEKWENNPYKDEKLTCLRPLKLDDELRNWFNFKDKQIIRYLINECKTKHTAIHLSKLFLYISWESLEISSEIIQILCEYLNSLDMGELDIVIKLYRNIVLIQDSLNESRVSILY